MKSIGKNIVTRISIQTTICLVSFAGMISSCSLFNPASPVPTYLKIDSIHLRTDPSTQGSNSSKITDAWVFVDQKYIGTFPLPANVPIIADGIHNIIIHAGVIENGIASTRSAYPKYSGLDTSFDMHANQSYSISPVVTYNSATVFAQMEDFDDANISFTSTANGSAPLTILSSLNPNAFEENSGIATMDSTHPVFEVASSTPMYLPQTPPVYLELNYKSDVDFTIGDFITAGSVNQNPFITLRATSVWKKIYISMTDLGAIWSNGTAYKIYFHAEKSSTASTSSVYLDNIKVLY